MSRSGLRGIDWRSVRLSLGDKITPEDQRLIDLLTAGKSTPQIARELQTNRSRIWRRIQKIKAQLLA